MAKIFISFNVVTSDDIIVVVRDMDNLAGEVWRQYYAAPHSQRNITVDDLDPVMHRVQIWSTPDGSTLGTLKGACDIDASINTSVTAVDLIQFVVNRGWGDPYFDPTTPTTQYVNPNLEGKNYAVFKPGFGALIWGQHIQTIDGGGFEYIPLSGLEFEDQEEYTVLVFNPVTTVTPDTGGPSGGGFPTGVVEITDDTTFASVAHAGKILKVNSSNQIVEIEIPIWADVAENTMFSINTHQGTQRYVKLILPSGISAKVRGVDRNTLYVGKGEVLQLIKSGSEMVIVQWEGDVHRVGEIVKSDGIGPANSVPETGGWYLKVQYPRLYEWYVEALNVADLGTGTQDVTPDDDNKGKWIIGTTKFWVPDRRSRFERNSDGTRRSGDVQEEEVGPHFHDVGTNVNPLSYFLRSVVPHLYRSWTVGNNSGLVGKESTDVNRNAAGLQYTSENRPENIAVFSYRII